MRWQKPNLKSIYGLLGQAGPPAEPYLGARMETVRQAMLDAMASAGLGQRHLHIVGRIQFAQGIQALWYVRSDMMTALAAELGEAAAREKIDALSALFEGLLPKGFSYQQPPRRN